MGITGQWLPGDEEQIIAGINRAYQHFRLIFSYQSYTLLSLLAAGADQRKAECILKFGICPVTTLPRHVDIYINDFIAQESKQDFSNVLNNTDKDGCNV
jgi:hypothetical protein